MVFGGNRSGRFSMSREGGGGRGNGEREGNKEQLQNTEEK